MDGTTTKNDWLGLTPIKELPRVVNPPKGYIVTANNRVVPDTARSDIGSTVTTTARSLRITELIKRQLELGKRFTTEDTKAIMLDQLDVQAREVFPSVMRIAQSSREYFSGEDLADLDEVLGNYYVQHWFGDMKRDSIGASVYSVWHAYFSDSLLHDFIETRESRLSIAFTYAFQDFYQRLLLKLDADADDAHMNQFCRDKNVN